MFQVSQSPAVEIQQTQELPDHYGGVADVLRKRLLDSRHWCFCPIEAVEVCATTSCSNNIVGAVTAAGMGPQMDALHMLLFYTVRKK